MVVKKRVVDNSVCFCVQDQRVRLGPQGPLGIKDPLQKERRENPGVKVRVWIVVKEFIGPRFILHGPTTVDLHVEQGKKMQ